MTDNSAMPPPAAPTPIPALAPELIADEFGEGVGDGLAELELSAVVLVDDAVFEEEVAVLLGGGSVRYVGNPDFGRNCMLTRSSRAGARNVSEVGLEQLRAPGDE